MGIRNQEPPAMEGGSQQQNLELTFYLSNEGYIGLQQHEHEVGHPSGCLQFPSQQFSEDNFSTNLPEHGTLESMVKPHLTNCFRSSPDDSNRNMIKQSFFWAQEKQSSGFVTAPCKSAASSGSVLPRKSRFRWTPDIHVQFVQFVNLLGGAEKTTPKAILKLMKSKSNELTITHIKSHLQKYRSQKYINSESLKAAENPAKRDCIGDMPQLYLQTGRQIREALQMLLQVQKHLHEQLEIQRNLLILIEENLKQVKTMLEKQKANKRQVET